MTLKVRYKLLQQTLANYLNVEQQATETNQLVPLYIYIYMQNIFTNIFINWCFANQ